MSIPFQQYSLLLGKYLKPQTRRVWGLAIVLLANIGLQIINPQIIGYFIDTVTAAGASDRLMMATVAFIAIALLVQGTAIAATYLGEGVAWTATNALRLDLVAHCLGLDLAFHKTHTPGELLERIDGDVNLLSQFFSQLVIHVLGNGLLLIGIIGVLYWENWLAGASLSAFAAIALGILLAQRSMAIAPWAEYRQISADFYGMLGERISGREDLRGNGSVPYVMVEFYRLLQRWLPAYQRARFSSTVLWFTSVGLLTIGNAIALTVAAYLWSQQAITIGSAYLIFHYTNLLAQPIERIREELEQLQQVEASIYRIQELQQHRSPLVDCGQAVLPTGALAVAWEGVSFSYTAERHTLQDISFDLSPGQVLGILGRTGSGKSTIARLLLRLYDCQGGTIRIGDRPIADFPLASLRQRVGFVTQDVQIFQASVRDNLTFFNDRIPDRRILDVLEDLQLGEWFASLPAGLDSQLGADSGGLSAGQAQLLALVRVFLNEPGLVILDEASSRLDPHTEAAIDRSITKLLTDRTGIIIAHRLQTLDRADRLLILDRGRILEYGDRQTLLDTPNSHFVQIRHHYLDLLERG